MRKTNVRLASYLNRAMRTLRRSILAMVTNIMVKINATFEYESVPSIHNRLKMNDEKAESI
jgi:hypothetical protein